MPKDGLTSEIEESTEIDEADIDKAGFVIYGLNGKGTPYNPNQLCVVAGYTQNRYGNDPTKAYSLIKGSVDDGETPFKGGKREAEEESGISIKKLLGDAAYAELKTSVKTDGGDVKPKKPGAYAGVKVKRAYATPTQFSYTSAVGKTKHMQMYFIELEDGAIDKLQPKLKGPPIADSQSYNDSAPELHFTTDDYVEQQHYPTLTEMLAVLKTGKIQPKSPAPDGWPKKETVIFKKPDLPKLLEAMGEKNMKGWDETRWHRFCDEAKAKEPSLYKKVLKDIGKLKKFFKEKELIGDDGFMKFDGTDRPLTFFFEGADVLPVSHLIVRSARYAGQNQPYAEAMWGGPNAYWTPNDKPSKSQSMELGSQAQIAGFFPQANNQTLEKSKHFSVQAVSDSFKTMVGGMKEVAQQQLRCRVKGLADSLKSLQL